MTTPTPGDLSARLPELPEPAIELPAPRYVAYTAEQMLAFRNEGIAAALSALPAAGGAVATVVHTELSSGDTIIETTWHGPILPPGTKLYTTPQPSAAEDDAVGAWEIALLLATARRNFRASDAAGDVLDWLEEHASIDAAVGAQGDGVALMREASEVLAAVGTSGVALPENWRWPLVDELSGQAALLSAAPAAGEGVDAHARELLAVEYERGELFEVATIIRRGNIPAGWKDDCIALRAISAALTRQPATCECAQCRRNRALYNRDSPFVMEPLPERDASRTNSEQGLYRKFDVRRTDGSDEPGGKHHGCEYFVLDVKHDPLAKAALAGYADAAEATHQQLAADLRERYSLTRQPVAGDGPEQLTLQELVRALAQHHKDISGDTRAFPAAQVAAETAGALWRIIRAHRRAAPAATPTDGGEG